MPLEYNRFNASDCLFFGDSYGVDIACDIFRKVRANSHTIKIDDAIALGPGTMMSRYANLLEIDLIKAENFSEIMYRKGGIGIGSTRKFRPNI
jgi:hypothetical protein